jgi:ATP/maltotriose-dependent transcriptional regulator MalT
MRKTRFPGAAGRPIRAETRTIAPQRSFVNRVGELSALAEEADRASRGEPRVVHLSGPAGIGKSALIDVFLAAHGELATVAVTGAEAEAGVHLGVADTLLRGLAVGAGLTADPASAAARADPLACGVALVELLGLIQSPDRVVAVVVDDLHWVDPASIVALAFAFRRLNTDRILAVLVGREEARPDTPLGRLVAGPRGRQLHMRGLDVTAVREMASRLSSHSLSAARADALQVHTGGNPLYLRALLAELPPGEVVGAQRLPAPKGFAANALVPLARSPEPARRLVAAAAVLGMEARLADAAQLAAVSAPAEAAAAAPATLVEMVELPLGWMLRFTHPLNRAAVYHDLPPGERARLHCLAAEHTNGRAALWHRVHAAFRPDPALAADLARLAAEEAVYGQLETAAEDLAAAARVHPDAAARQRLLLDAADLRLLGSDPSAAAALLSTVPDHSGSRWHYVHGHLTIVAGRLPEGEAELRTAWEHISPGDDDLRGLIACWLAQLAIMRARGEDGARWAARAVDALPPSHPRLSMCRAYIGVALWIAGRTEQAMASMAGLPADPAAVTSDDAAQLGVRGQLRVWADDLEGARADCARAIRLGRESGLPPYLPAAIGGLAEAEYRLGVCDDAIVHGDLGISLVEDTDQHWYRAFAHGIAALVRAAQGGWKAAEMHVATARAAAQLLGNEASHGYAANAAAHLAFARQDWAGIVAAGAPLYKLGSRDGTFEPGVFGWRELYDEALITVGRLAEARRDVQESLDLAMDRGRRSTLARLSRPQAALAMADGDARRARWTLEEGIEHAAAGCCPFDQALVHDALGRLLRRQGERRRAASHLQAALDRYEQLRAAPFLSRCRDELAACGLHPARRAPGPTGLTPREHAVVHLAARGLTNRQIAAELVISVKTVEYHLGSVFAKLGVSTRTQLAARLAEGQTT